MNGGGASWARHGGRAHDLDGLADGVAGLDADRAGMGAQRQPAALGRGGAEGVAPAVGGGRAEQAHDADVAHVTRHLLGGVIRLAGNELDFAHGYEVVSQDFLLLGRVAGGVGRGLQERGGAAQTIQARGQGKRLALLGDVQDNVSGKLTVNLASLKMDDTATQIGIDMRVPVTLSLDEFQKRMRKAVHELGWRYEEYDHLEPLYIPANSPLVQTLCQSYGAVMGGECIPTASGGITYARAISNCVPFGAHFPHHPYQAHMPNESLSMDDLLLASEIYAVALQRLQKTALRTSMVHPE